MYGGYHRLFISVYKCWGISLNSLASLGGNSKIHTYQLSHVHCPRYKYIGARRPSGYQQLLINFKNKPDSGAFASYLSVVFGGSQVYYVSYLHRAGMIYQGSIQKCMQLNIITTDGAGDLSGQDTSESWIYCISVLNYYTTVVTWTMTQSSCRGVAQGGDWAWLYVGEHHHGSS